MVAVYPTRPVLYAAQVFEMGTSGLGTGAFMVLLLRLTQKRFSTMQYALLSSLMAITRVFTGPPAALLVDALGWRDFYILTLLAGIPGMVMLGKFVPWSVRDPQFHVAPPTRRPPMSRGAIISRAVLAGVACLILSLATTAVMGGVRAYNSGRTKALVVNVRPGEVDLYLKVAESSLAGGVKAIKEVTQTLPLADFEAAPVAGDRVAVIQSRDEAGTLHLSRKKVLERRFSVGPALMPLLHPRTLDEGFTTGGLVVFAALCGLAVAAALVARRGMAKATAGA